MSVEINDAVIELLNGLAEQDSWSDDVDFMIDDYAGGNLDDAYYGGFKDGQIDLAREILELIGDPDVAS